MIITIKDVELVENYQIQYNDYVIINETGKGYILNFAAQTLDGNPIVSMSAITDMSKNHITTEKIII